MNASIAVHGFNMKIDDEKKHTKNLFRDFLFTFKAFRVYKIWKQVI